MVYLDPFEIVAKRVLPSFRKEIVKELKKEMSDQEIIKALEITPVALYYYKKELRGIGFEFNNEEKEEIRKIAKAFLKTKDVFVLKKGFKKLVDKLFAKKRLCPICGKDGFVC